MNPLLSPDAALDLILDAARPHAPVSIPIADALSLILAESIAADRDYPPFNRSMMDGFAVRMADAGKNVSVIGEIAAGSIHSGALRDGQAIEIMTGAACPEGTEAVAEKEVVQREGLNVTLPETLKPGQNIARKGNECRAGAIALESGTLLTPLALAILASVGCTTVQAIPRPRIAIINTGNELLRGESPIGAAQIRDSNGPMLAALARAAGLTEISTHHAEDTPESLRRVLAEAFILEPQIVALTGGVSEGKYDIVPAALAEIGARTVFHKVNQRPGKPFLFAVQPGSPERGRPTPSGDSSTRLFFGLPGNPLSSHLCFHRYVLAAVRKMSGLPSSPLLLGRLAERFKNAGPRVVFQLARADWTGAEWKLIPIRGKGSADLFAVARANALIRFDPQPDPIAADTVIPFELLDP